jgi:hypothetical protein
MSFTDIDTQPDVVLQFPLMSKDRMLARIQQSDPELHRDITSKSWITLPQALADRIEAWKVQERQRIQAETENLNKQWRDEQANVVARNAERRKQQADAQAGMARLMAYASERKLVDNPANAKLIADFLQDRQLPFSESSVDQAVLALQHQLQWHI